jgi:hypothetical protein
MAGILMFYRVIHVEAGPILRPGSESEFQRPLADNQPQSPTSLQARLQAVTFTAAVAAKNLTG